MSKGLDKLTAGYLEEFSKGINADSAILSMPAFSLNKATFVESAKEFLHSALKDKMPQLESGLNKLAEGGQPSAQEMPSIISARRLFAPGNSPIAMPKLTEAAKKHAIVKSFTDAVANVDMTISPQMGKEELKDNPRVQALAATLYILKHQYPDSTALIRSRLGDDEGLKNKNINQAVEQLERLPNPATVRVIYNHSPDLLREKNPDMFMKVKSDPVAYGPELGANKSDRYGEMEWIAGVEAKKQNGFKLK